MHRLFIRTGHSYVQVIYRYRLFISCRGHLYAQVIFHVQVIYMHRLFIGTGWGAVLHRLEVLVHVCLVR